MSINSQSTFMRWLRYAHVFVGRIAILFVVVTLVDHLLLTITRVDGQSMEPTLHNGQLLLVDLISPHFKSLKVGDMVVARYAGDPSLTFVKRIAGTHDQPDVAEPKGKEVPTDSYFLLGDNPPFSTDSRVFGSIDKSLIVGRVIELKIPTWNTIKEWTGSWHF